MLEEKLVAICEDIREEIHNKHSLMGVYQDEIVVLGMGGPMWPARLNLGFYAVLGLSEREARPDRCILRLTHNNETDLLRHEGPIVVSPEKKRLQFAVKFGQVVVPAPGELSFEITLYAGDVRLGVVSRKVGVRAEKQDNPT